MRAQGAAPGALTPQDSGYISGNGSNITTTASREMHHFVELTPDDQHSAIRHLADSGFGDYGIAAATRLSVEMVRQILGDRKVAESRA
jgi:hypothetical protein